MLKKYRNNEIASNLINNFMKTTDYDCFIVDCKNDLRPFYNNLRYDNYFLSDFK